MWGEARQFWQGLLFGASDTAVGMPRVTAHPLRNGCPVPLARTQSSRWFPPFWGGEQSARPIRIANQLSIFFTATGGGTESKWVGHLEATLFGRPCAAIFLAHTSSLVGCVESPSASRALSNRNESLFCQGFCHCWEFECISYQNTKIYCLYYIEWALYTNIRNIARWYLLLYRQ